jgi:hypothetical protein
VLQPGGRVDHEVQRSGPLADLAAESLARSGARWPARLADAMSGRGRPRGRKPGPSLAALQPPLPDDATLLTSWIIARV